MKYYNTKGEIVDIQKGTLKFWGTSASIFSITDTMLWKEYYEQTPLNARMDSKTFPLLRQLHHPFLNQVYDLFYAVDKIEDQCFPNLDSYKTDGYLYEYLVSQKIDILKKDIEYVFYNVDCLEELIIDIFPEMKIKVDDLKWENVVFHDDKIVLIDWDNFRVKEREDRETIRTHNKEKLNLLFKNLCMRGESYSCEYNRIVEEIFSASKEATLSKELKRTLKPEKNIRDYLEKHRF